MGEQCGAAVAEARRVLSLTCHFQRSLCKDRPVGPGPVCWCKPCQEFRRNFVVARYVLAADAALAAWATWNTIEHGCKEPLADGGICEECLAKSRAAWADVVRLTAEARGQIS